MPRCTLWPLGHREAPRDLQSRYDRPAVSQAPCGDHGSQHPRQEQAGIPPQQQPALGDLVQVPQGKIKEAPPLKLGS